VAKFSYLGTAETDQNYIREEMKSNLNQRTACCDSVQNLFSSPLLSRNLKKVVAAPMKRVPGALPLGYSGRVVKLTTHFHLMSRLKLRGAILPLPHHVFTEWCSI